ncbi:MAG: hypothetical protein ACEQR8_10885, partial [Cypionkella sp.]
MRIELADLAAMDALGARIARALRPGDVEASTSNKSLSSARVSLRISPSWSPAKPRSAKPDSNAF